jgi:hypothetical protein
LETVQITLKKKIQDVNGECSLYHPQNGKPTAGDAQSIAVRLTEKMKGAGKFLKENPEAVTPEIADMYNRAIERGKGVLGEHKTKNPTLFDDTEGKAKSLESTVVALNVEKTLLQNAANIKQKELDRLNRQNGDVKDIEELFPDGTMISESVRQYRTEQHKEVENG